MLPGTLKRPGQHRLHHGSGHAAACSPPASRLSSPGAHGWCGPFRRTALAHHHGGRRELTPPRTHHGPRGVKASPGPGVWSRAGQRRRDADGTGCAHPSPRSARLRLRRLPPDRDLKALLKLFEDWETENARPWLGSRRTVRDTRLPADPARASHHAGEAEHQSDEASEANWPRRLSGPHPCSVVGAHWVTPQRASHLTGVLSTWTG